MLGSDLVKYRRYGNFRFRDYISTWCAIALLISMESLGFWEKMDFLYMMPFSLIILYMLYDIVEPNMDYLRLVGNSIIVTKGRKRRIIGMPDELTLIFSHADVCNSFIKKIGAHNSTYDLKKRYAISILRNDSAESIIRRLHANNASLYTNTMIEISYVDSFDAEKYVYSFVYDEHLLYALVTSRQCQLIIPQSLLQVITIDLKFIDVHIDTNC